MCGTFYIEDDVEREIKKLIRATERNKQHVGKEMELKIQTKNIRPTDYAPVLVAGEDGFSCEFQKWGIHGKGQSGIVKSSTLLINARSETALDRPMFKESVRKHRAVIPASGFYEWNRQKEKSSFRRKDAGIMYMAGFYKWTEEGKYFVILTTQANESVEPVHDRMPLILEEDEVSTWIYEDLRTEELLKKVPCLLDCKSDYRQVGLFD